MNTLAALPEIKISHRGGQRRHVLQVFDIADFTGFFLSQCGIYNNERLRKRPGSAPDTKLHTSRRQK